MVGYGCVGAWHVGPMDCKAQFSKGHGRGPEEQACRCSGGCIEGLPCMDVCVSLAMRSLRTRDINLLVDKILFAIRHQHCSCDGPMLAIPS